LENVVRELHKLGIDTFVWVSTKKKNDRNYISQIDILLDDDIDENNLSYALENMKTKLLGGNYNGS
jgi:choline kinase